VKGQGEAMYQRVSVKLPTVYCVASWSLLFVWWNYCLTCLQCLVTAVL